MAKESATGAQQAYWRANLKLVGWCLLVWFTVSYGCGILLVEALNGIQLFGFKLGFWFAQQGSIYVFLVLIFFYAWRMNKLDRRFGVAEQDDADEEDRRCP
jgi:putative solute:sodium symporter small subunit